MTTQGARKTASKPKPETGEASNELSLNQWLAKRGLTEKRMQVGEKWFRFVGAATPAQLAEYHEAHKKGELVGIMAAFLVDPSERDELAAALESQGQPIEAKQSGEFLAAILNFLVAGDVGESSAS